MGDMSSQAGRQAGRQTGVKLHFLHPHQIVHPPKGDRAHEGIYVYIYIIYIREERTSEPPVISGSFSLSCDTLRENVTLSESCVLYLRPMPIALKAIEWMVEQVTCFENVPWASLATALLN